MKNHIKKTVIKNRENDGREEMKTMVTESVGVEEFRKFKKENPDLSTASKDFWKQLLPIVQAAYLGEVSSSKKALFQPKSKKKSSVSRDEMLNQLFGFTAEHKLDEEIFSRRK